MVNYNKISREDSRGPAPFPPICVELERLIMEFAAARHPETALSLTRVSQAVQKWIDPILYHTVVLRSSRLIKSFSLTVQIPKFRELALHVRWLIITGQPPSGEDVSGAIMRACTKVECMSTVFSLDTDLVGMHTAPSQWPTPWHVMLTSMAGEQLPDPRRMALALAGMAEQLPTQGYPYLRNTTHLYVGLMNADIVSTLRLVPRLTHLAFRPYCTPSPDLHKYVRRILNDLPIVECVLVVASASRSTDLLHGYPWGELAEITDHRLFVCPMVCEDGGVKVMRSGKTIWDDVESKYKDWREFCHDT